MDTLTIANKRGRPEINIVWPDGVFTVNQVSELMPGTISKVTIQAKITKALKTSPPTLKIVGKLKSRGRGTNQYEKV